MRALRTILVLVLIVLRPVLLAVLWPVAALVRFVTFGSPLVLFFIVAILLHTSGPLQRSFGWSLIATMAGFALASAGLTALQRKLREDPTLWFARAASGPELLGTWQRRNFMPRRLTTAGVRPYARSFPHLRRQSPLQ